MISVSTTKIRDCCNRAASSEIIEGLVEAKLTALLTSLSQKTRLDVDKIAVTVSQLDEALEEVKELKAWKRIAEEKHGVLRNFSDFVCIYLLKLLVAFTIQLGIWDGVLSELQHRLDERGSLSSQMGISVEEAIKRWDVDSKPALIKNIKEELLTEIRRQIKLLNAVSGQGLSKEEVERLIHSALGVYDSDKTGLADFALEPAGKSKQKTDQ